MKVEVVSSGDTPHHRHRAGRHNQSCERLNRDGAHSESQAVNLCVIEFYIPDRWWPSTALVRFPRLNEAVRRQTLRVRWWAMVA
jgi:hypothetical protein